MPLETDFVYLLPNRKTDRTWKQGFNEPCRMIS